MKQNNGEPLDVSLQVTTFFALNEGFFKNVKIEDVKKTELELHKYVQMNAKDLMKDIDSGKWKDEEIAKLKQVLKDFAGLNNIDF